MENAAPTIVEELGNAPHPATFGAVRLFDRTQWMPSDDAIRVPKSTEMSVRCQIVEIEIHDDYGEVVSCVPAVRHQAFNAKQKKWHTDVSVSELRAGHFMTEKKSIGANIIGLKQRFGTAIAEYERWLVKEGRDLPIVLLADQVYPQAINMLRARGVLTVNALAGQTDAELAVLRQALLAQKYERLSGLVEKFRDKARGRLAALGVKPAAPDGEGKAASGRPQRAA